MSAHMSALPVLSDRASRRGGKGRNWSPEERARRTAGRWGRQVVVAIRERRDDTAIYWRARIATRHALVALGRE
jgi:hypothetical protein